MGKHHSFPRSPLDTSLRPRVAIVEEGDPCGYNDTRLDHRPLSPGTSSHLLRLLLAGNGSALVRSWLWLIAIGLAGLYFVTQRDGRGGALPRRAIS